MDIYQVLVEYITISNTYGKDSKEAIDYDLDNKYKNLLEINKLHKSKLNRKHNCPWCSKTVLSTPNKIRDYDITYYPWCGNSLYYNKEKNIGMGIVQIISSREIYYEVKCIHTGISLTTDIIHKDYNLSHEVRVGIAILGSLNDDNHINANPFDKYFYDNYAKGVGNTLDEALQNLEKDLESLSKTLF